MDDSRQCCYEAAEELFVTFCSASGAISHLREVTQALQYRVEGLFPGAFAIATDPSHDIRSVPGIERMLTAPLDEQTKCLVTTVDCQADMPSAHIAGKCSKCDRRVVYVVVNVRLIALTRHLTAAAFPRDGERPNMGSLAASVRRALVSGLAMYQQMPPHASDTAQRLSDFAAAWLIMHEVCHALRKPILPIPELDGHFLDDGITAQEEFGADRAALAVLRHRHMARDPLATADLRLLHIAPAAVFSVLSLVGAILQEAPRDWQRETPAIAGQWPTPWLRSKILRKEGDALQELGLLGENGSGIEELRSEFDSFLSNLAEEIDGCV